MQLISLLSLFSIVCATTTLRKTTTTAPPTTCPLGYYVYGTQCLQCGPNTYTNTHNATSCTNCPAGQHSGYTSSSCITCLPYQFFFASGGGPFIPISFCSYCVGAPTYYYNNNCVTVCPVGTTATNQMCSGVSCPACL